MKSKLKSFKQLFAKLHRAQKERIRKAGKHVCVKTPCGTVRRVTGRNDIILKRPVLVMRFYECKVCGRDMTHGLGKRKENGL